MMTVMPSRLRHYQHTGSLHFIPFSCFHRRPKLAAARTALECSLEQARRAYAFCVISYVVMPEHVHLLLSELDEAALATCSAGTQTIGSANAGPACSRALLAGAVLRLQCVECAQARGKTAVHALQPGGAWVWSIDPRIHRGQLPA